MSIVLPEIISVGIYQSQFAVKNKTVSKKRKTALFELELPIESGGISYIDTQQHKIEPNMLICSKPGQTRHTKFPYRCYYIHMILREGALYDMLMSMPDFIQTDKQQKYSEIFKRMCKYYDTRLEEDNIILQGLILELVHSMNNDAKKSALQSNIKSNNYQLTEKVIGYIKENLISDLSLENVARYAGLSPIHFHNFFKASTGETLRQYVEEQRIKKAVNMLLTTDFTLTKIAYECGFSSQSYFSYAFKRKMKLTPRQYAQKVFLRYEAE